VTPARARQLHRALPVLVIAVALGAACGKKGPPLPPLANVPAAPTDVSTRRSGETVTIRFTVPRANVTNIQPANIERVDVYAWTGEQLPPEQIYKLATVVASVPVRRPPPPPPERKEGEPPPPPPPPPTGPGVDQGTAVEVTEQLTPETLVPVVVPEKEKKKDDEEVVVPVLTPPEVTLLPDETPYRYYIVVGVNRSGRRGPAAPRQAVPLWSAPAKPADLRAEVQQSGVVLQWTPPAFMRRPILLAPAPAPPGSQPAPAAGAPARPGAGPQPTGVGTPPPGEPDEEEEEEEESEEEAVPTQPGAAASQAPTPPVTPGAPGAPGSATTSGQAPQTGAAPGAPATAGSAAAAPPQATTTTPLTAEGLIPSRVLTPWPALSTGFMVYEVAPPNAKPPAGVPPPPAVQPFPRAVTSTPSATPKYEDRRLEFGTQRCYVVRTVETVGTMVVESDPSNVACVKPVDVFPPAAPKSLGAVASEGAISLIWDANAEPDLGGYIVLRGVAPGDRLEPLTPAPIHETTFRDATVKPGTRYVYVVIAVDTAKPPNRSGPSNRVEETAR
jgi:hypothetical protein